MSVDQTEDDDGSGDQESSFSGDEISKLRKDELRMMVAAFRNYLLRIANEFFDTDMQGHVGASDLVQDASMKALENISEYRGKSVEEFLGWLRAILINHARNVRKKQHRESLRKVDISPGLINDQMERANSQSGGIGQEERARVDKALKKLPAVYQEVILLFLADLSWQDIGAILKRSADAARKMYDRAIRKLTRELASEQ